MDESIEKNKSIFNSKVKLEGDISHYQNTSIISLFETNAPNSVAATPSPIGDAKSADLHQTFDSVPNHVCITECGGVKIPHETLIQNSRDSVLSLFEMEESAYSLTDMSSSLSDAPNLLPLSSFLHQQTHGYAHAKPESAPIVLRAVQEMNQFSSLKDPRAHRRYLYQLAHQLDKENRSDVMPLLFPHFLIKGLVKGWRDNSLWLKKAIASFRETINTYENRAKRDAEGLPRKRKVHLSSYLATKAGLGQIERVMNLLELSQAESAPHAQQFNRFVLKALKSQIPRWQKEANYYATVADCHFLLQILEKEAIGQVMVKKSIEEMLNERIVSTKRLRQHCLSMGKPEHARVFRKLSHQDYSRINFEAILKEKTSGFITRISKGFTAEHYMWPYSSVCTSPVVRLPADWRMMDFPILLHHAVLRSYAIQRSKKSAIRYATGTSNITKEGNFTLRSTKKESFLLLDANSFPNTNKTGSNIWANRSKCSIMRCTEQEYYKLLGNIDEGDIHFVHRPIESRQDIRVRVKSFREMCAKNREAIKRKLKLDGVEGLPDEKHEHRGCAKNTPNKKKTEIVPNPYMNSSEDEGDDYHGQVRRNYTPMPANPSILDIHRKILTKHADLHPETFQTYLKPKAPEENLFPKPFLTTSWEIKPKEEHVAEKDPPVVTPKDIVEY
ncbi:hypothetical protein XU18_2851 [Perkinsela sp. CCAP 1560/4]|nr:hypothetical protein XU18_2851 [Perkinsela sp. CCAP 1560/4]|eukprot:KNH06346.1 hypothetical protein XU18_2851 [Perkinsela sp. CCAP 1560/4]